MYMYISGKFTSRSILRRDSGRRINRDGWFHENPENAALRYVPS